MSIKENNTRLVNNNTNLNELLNSLNTLPSLNLQEKTVTPTTEKQTVTYDEGYNGLSKVNIEAVQSSKYQPRYMYEFLKFRDYTGTELDQETKQLDTTYFTTLLQMFSGCSNITSLDLSGWYTPNVTDMRQVFLNCSKLNTLDISNFTTSKVTNMSNMFNGCYRLPSLNLSSWDTSKVTDMSGMFQYCLDIMEIDIRNFTFDKVTSYSDMFTRVPNGCLIIVKSNTEKQWITSKFTNLTNVKTVAEL